MLLQLELGTNCLSWSSMVSCASWELSPWLYRTIVQSDCLAQTTYCIITFTLWLVAGQSSPMPGLHIPPPRLLSSCSAGRHVDSPDRRIWHSYRPRSQAIINRIMSRSTVRYLILSNGKKKNPLPRMLMLFSQPLLGGTQQCQEVQSLRKVSGWGRRLMFSQ